MIVALLVLLVPVVGGAQDLAAIDEMRSQANRFYEQGRPCEAAQRYRAIVGDRPELFRRFAESKAACLLVETSETSVRPQPSDD